jgi:hypothetical protein
MIIFCLLQSNRSISLNQAFYDLVPIKGSRKSSIKIDKKLDGKKSSISKRE